MTLSLTIPKSFILSICLILFHAVLSLASNPRAISDEYDVVIYGNTVAALAAAIQTSRMKKTVAIVFPGYTLGGSTTSGLGWTDSKDGKTIGGIAREFYEKVYDYYQEDDAWKYETRDDYLAKKIYAQPGWAIDEKNKVQWTFEPKVAEEIWEKWIKDEDIPVFRNESIERSSSSVVKDGTRIVSFQTLTGSVFSAKMFIDAGYEGDLMETAGIPYRVGRESREEYGESAAGVLIDTWNEFPGFDPYAKRKSPRSGLIPGIQRVIRDVDSTNGTGDSRLQSYNYRLSLTKLDENQIPFFKPPGYNESHYEILFRYIESGYSGPFFTYQLMPNLKTDTNAKGQVSTDLIGGNFDSESNYAEYSYEERKKVALKHKVWAQGLFWTLANHRRIPRGIKMSVGKWGYAKDEWIKNDNWPHEIYIREGRRMNGVYTMTQDDIQNPSSTPNDTLVGIGSYTLDVHQVERVVVDGRLHIEGLVHIPVQSPFNIPFGAIIPRSQHATNFLNPVTLSCTHVALSAVRMEPTYMIMGQSAAIAAVLAIEQDVDIQDVDRDALMKQLKGDRQVLESESRSMRPSIVSLVVAFISFYLSLYVPR